MQHVFYITEPAFNMHYQAVSIFHSIFITAILRAVSCEIGSKILIMGKDLESTLKGDRKSLLNPIGLSLFFSFFFLRCIGVVLWTDGKEVVPCQPFGD